MITLRAAALSLFLAATTAVSASAEGIAQVVFGGRVTPQVAVPGEGEVPAPFGGQLVEIEVGSVVQSVEADLVLHIYLAEGTSGADLARLVARRLELSGIEALASINPATEGRTATGSLWIEATRYVHLRLGGGLTGTIACAEGGPASVRVVPPSEGKAPATLQVDVSTAFMMRDRPPLRGRAGFKAAFGAAATPAGAANAVWKASSESFVGDRQGGDVWRPHRMVSGAAITGASLAFEGSSPWRLEVAL